jgi:TonB family protein
MDTVQTAEDQTTGPQATSRPQQDQQNAQSGQQASQQQTNDSPAEASQGKPLPSSDFESFPITTIASQMVDGRIEARGGRRMKTRREPDIGLAGWADLATMADPQVVLELKIDETGNVVDVQVLHTSGSDNVDLPCRRAAATWWMEPFIDPKTGKPHPQIVDFTISFR